MRILRWVTRNSEVLKKKNPRIHDLSRINFGIKNICALIVYRTPANKLREPRPSFYRRFSIHLKRGNKNLAQCAGRPRSCRTFSSVHQNTWNGKTAEYFSCYMSIRIGICIHAELAIYISEILLQERNIDSCGEYMSYRRTDINRSFIVYRSRDDDDDDD